MGDWGGMVMLRRLSVVLTVLLAAGSLVSVSAGVRLGAVSVGAGYGYASGPYRGAFWPGYYPPLFYDPWFYPFYSPVVVLSPQPDTGQVSLQGVQKSAAVYLDGAYAGTASSLKKFWLAPGVYELEVRPVGQAPQSKRIYVLTGKTLKVSME